MTGLNLDDFNFEGAIFSKCKLTGSTFKGSDFTFSRFEKCLINDCDMSNCNVQESSFTECDISKSDLHDSLLIEVNFRQAVFHSTDFSGAYIKDSVLIDAEGDTPPNPHLVVGAHVDVAHRLGVPICRGASLEE